MFQQPKKNIKWDFPCLKKHQTFLRQILEMTFFPAVLPQDTIKSQL